MKHLILVHSHISYMVINQYIIENNIDPDDCLFILNARYRHLPEGNSYSNFIFFPDELLPNGYFRVFYHNNIVIGAKNLKYLEDRINSFFHGDSFYMYCTTTSLDYVSALVTMKQCKGYYLLEEGSSSYYTSKEVPLAFSGMRLLCIRLLSIFLPRYYVLKVSRFAFDNKYFLGSVATDRKAFSDFPGEHKIISQPFAKVSLGNIPEIILSIDSSIIICLGNIFPEELYKRINVFFKNKGYTRIAYKFHPKYYVDPELLKIFREGLSKVFGNNILELDESVQIENWLMSYPIDFCADLSSIGIYATNFGRKCYSYMELMPVLFPDSSYVEDFIKPLPKIIYHSYSFIPMSEFQE